MLDTDIARIYGIPTFRLNEAVKRNSMRFPGDFMFRLTPVEYRSLTSQSAMSKNGRGGRRTLPYAFTEHGAIMAANILNSRRAVRMSVYIVRAFVRMRSTLMDSSGMARKLAALELELRKRLDIHETAIVDILRRVMDILDPLPLPVPKKRPIGFRLGERDR